MLIRLGGSISTGVHRWMLKDSRLRKHCCGFILKMLSYSEILLWFNDLYWLPGNIFARFQSDGTEMVFHAVNSTIGMNKPIPNVFHVRQDKNVKKCFRQHNRWKFLQILSMPGQHVQIQNIHRKVKRIIYCWFSRKYVFFLFSWLRCTVAKDN